MTQEKSAKEIIIGILDNAELVLNGFDFVPELDKNGDLVQANVNLSLVLVDQEDGSLSAKDVIEKHMIGEDESLSDVLEAAEPDDEDKENTDK